MRFLQVGDVHSGKTLGGHDLTQDLRHVLGQVVATAREREVDAVLVAGDLYDSATPSATAVATVDGFLAELASVGCAVVVIPGNHDSAERVAYASSILARQGVHMAPVLGGVPEPVTLTDQWGPVDIWPVPFVTWRMVRSALDLDVHGNAEAFQALVDALPLDRSRRNVCVSHQFVVGSVAPELGDELRVGTLDAVEASAYDPFDYVALGHIHRPQNVGGPRIRYSGSPLKFGKGEASVAKSMTYVEMDGEGAIEVEEIPFEPLHDLRLVRGPLEQVVSAEVVGSAPADDYLMVELTDPEPVMDALERLRSAYPNLVSFRYRRPQAPEGPQPAVPMAQGVTALELFQEFYLAQTGEPLEGEALEMAAELLGEVEVV